MNSNSILTSNLLDIIFENRNKNYGAYVLRRDYNKRLLKSLSVMTALVSISAIWLMQKDKPSVIRLIQPTFTDTKILPPPQIIKPIKVMHAAANAKHASVPDNPPVIVPNDQVDKNLPQNQLMLTSVPGDYKDGPPSDGPAEFEGSEAVPEIKEADLPQATKKEIIETSPNIPPQFPGGIKELMKFLKRNLNTPQQLEKGEEIGVKVKFIVSYNGDLIGFNVIETGGASFDDEVMRVLKKMPKWIPGKTSGKNVQPILSYLLNSEYQIEYVKSLNAAKFFII